jgi:hypothetical protein
MMDLNSRYRECFKLYWPDVERYFGDLPLQLFRQGRLLRVHLAAAYSDTGELRDVLCREEDYPWLTLHFALLDDFDVPASLQRELLAKHVFLAMFFTVAASFVQESILDEEKGFDSTYALLMQDLSQQARHQLAHLFPNSSSLWSYHEGFWRDRAEALLWDAAQHSARTLARETELLLHTADKLAPSKTAIAAVALAAEREADLPHLFSLLDHLNLVLQVRQEITDARRDLMRGVYRYPAAKTIQVAGIAPDPLPRPEHVLGAMILTNAMDQICQECQAHLDACREIAAQLVLPSFGAHIEGVDAKIQESTATLALQPFAVKAFAGTETRVVVSKPHADALSKACEMAEGYLLSDLTFKESWEVHRWGMLGVPELVSREPSSLVIEVLCRHGHDMAAQVDAFYRNAQATGFCYYDHRHSIPDTDSLGALLRLYRYSDQKGAHAELLRTPLAWMEANVSESGRIPVWLTEQIDENSGRPPAIDLGEHCGVVEAHLLLGLIDYDWAHYQDIIVKSAMNLLDRLIAQDYALTVNYPPLYMLVVLLRLIAELSAREIPLLLKHRVRRAAERLRARLAREAQRQRLSPQDAAFVMLACAHPLTQSLSEPRWTGILLKHQRYDGGWDGFPFFFVPDRQETLTWYTSRTMTTAFCYDALRTWADNIDRHT